MTAATKLAIRQWAIRTLRKLVWRADEWIHRQEMKLREETHDLSEVCLSREPEAHKRREHHLAPGQRLAASSGPEGHDSPQKNQSDTGPGKAVARPIRASGPLFKQKRRRVTAAEFDLRFAR